MPSRRGKRAAKPTYRDVVLKEYPPVGRYRIRIIEVDGAKVLDIREHIDDGLYQGFTRRGIRLSADKALELSEALLSVADDISA